MKEFLGGMVLTALLGYLGIWIAWWGVVLGGAVAGFAMHRYGILAFVSGFLGGALLFGGYAYWLDQANQGELSAMMNEVFKFNPLLITILLGGLLGGMGSTTGKYARDVLLGERKVAKYRGKYH